MFLAAAKHAPTSTRVQIGERFCAELDGGTLHLGARGRYNDASGFFASISGSDYNVTSGTYDYAP